ncbi:hypothetical protein [Bacteroides nordii]|uniref:hypothetical protein n=1 Tax=Bacteroides nordii TaxID=291645 RepID=UPI0035203F26
MEKDYIMEVAQTIKSQLFGTTEINVLMSWGIEKFIATEYKDMPALKFKVNGRLFNGIVLIALNGSDYYEIYLIDDNGSRCICGEACFDEMVSIIDEAVERGTDIEEYNKFCGQQALII